MASASIHGAFGGKSSSFVYRERVHNQSTSDSFSWISLVASYKGLCWAICMLAYADWGIRAEGINGWSKGGLKHVNEKGSQLQPSSS